MTRWLLRCWPVLFSSSSNGTQQLSSESQRLFEVATNLLEKDLKYLRKHVDRRNTNEKQHLAVTTVLNEGYEVRLDPPAQTAKAETETFTAIFSLWVWTESLQTK